MVGATDHSTTKALYAKDPDGLEFEVCWLVPERFLDDDVVAAKSKLRPLDLQADIVRYGAETVGGV
jgi:catechol-2,3-dioxygenase